MRQIDDTTARSLSPAVYNELRTYSMPHLGDPDGGLVLDETGCLKNAVTWPASPGSVVARSGKWTTVESAYC